MANNNGRSFPSEKMKKLSATGNKKKSNNPIKKITDAMFGKKLRDLSFIDDASYTKLDKDFLCAVIRLEDIKKHLVDDQWLVAYSLYKQATEGDCKAKKPSKLFKTRFLKHEYWCRRYGMPTDVAAKRYVKTVAEYDAQVTKMLDLKKNKSSSRPIRQPRKVRARGPRKPDEEENRRGSVIPLTAEEAPASYEDGIIYAKPIRKLNRARASVEINKFLSVRLSSSGAAFSDDNAFANFGSVDGGSSVFIPAGPKRSTIILHQPPARQSVRTTYIPSEEEFKRFTLVRNSTIRSVTSMMTFQRPSYYYHGPSLEKLVAMGIKEKCPYKSNSIHLGATNIDEGYIDLLPVIHLLKVEFLKEIEKAAKADLDEDLEQIVTNVPLDRFMFRLVRYLDRWFEEKPSINSAGARSLIISKIYIETKFKKEVDELAVNQQSIYQLLSVCMLLSAKYCEDCLIANSYWSEVSGLPVQKLNKAEEMFLDATDFDLFITNEDLIKYGSKYHLAIGASPIAKSNKNHKKPSSFAQVV